MSAVVVNNIRLGDGRPKICVPVTDTCIEELKTSLDAMREKERCFELIEWRADKFDGIGDEDKLIKASRLIREVFPGKALIFTVRTNRDMEDFEISDEAYEDVNAFAAENGLADIIDLELSRGEALVGRLGGRIREKGLKVIISKHVPTETPDSTEIKSLFIKMCSLKADIIKLAVMPKGSGDVLRLMNATHAFTSEYPDTPVISMSMGRLGALSRVSGAVTGSCLTFGTVSRASAPGQLECGMLHEILKVL